MMPPAIPSVSSPVINASTASPVSVGLPLSHGLFGNFLISGNPTEAAATPILQQNGTTSQTVSSIDPSLLVLPQELSGLSNEDLQAILLNPDGLNEGVISNDILRALTTGIPVTPETKIPTNQLLSTVPTSPETGDTLVVTPLTTLTTESSLLSATGLSISDIEELRNTIKSALSDKISTTENLKDDLSVDANESTAALVFVMIIPPPQQTPILSSDTNIEFDAITFSSLTNTPVAPNSENDWIENQIAKIHKQTNGDAPLLDTDNPLLSVGQTKTENAGFQGSLSLLSGTEHNPHTPKSVIDAMDNSSQAGSHSKLLSSMDFSALNDNLLLLPNGNALPSAQASPLTNPLFTSASAVSAHPTAQAVAMMIEKAASGSDKAKQELSVQLDPPELGRLQIQLSMEKGGPMKVHLLAEKQETLNLLQRDSHVLKSALDSAGIQTDSGSLSFDLASGDQSFNQLMGQSQDQGSKSYGARFHLGADGSILNASDMHITETQMNFVTNAVTGNIHYSLLI